MCIICAKEAGIEMPSKELITTMWTNNPDGAGLMWSDGKCVHIQKGFMELDDLMDALKKLGNKRNLKNTPVVMHFRIATHGGINADCTHPFPLKPKTHDLRKTDFSSNIGVAHNGVIQIDTPEKAQSDTMAYITQVMYPLYCAYEKLGGVHNKDFQQIIENTIGYSRLAIMTGKGNIIRLGDSWVSDDSTGLTFSNSSYLPKKYETYKTGKYGGLYNFDYLSYEDDLYDAYKTYSSSSGTHKSYYPQTKLMTLDMLYPEDCESGKVYSDFGDYDASDFWQFAVDSGDGLWFYEPLDDVFIPARGQAFFKGEPVKYKDSLADFFNTIE